MKHENKNDKEFLEFLTMSEPAPAHLVLATQRDVLLSFHARSIILRFLGFQLLGGLFSLLVCPQFGLGLSEGHGISHVFRMMGDWACAAFCGSFFLLSAATVAMLGMKGEELWWIWRRYKFSMIMLPPVLWGTLMLFNVTFNLSGENLIYHVTWIISAILVQALWLQIRSGVYAMNFNRTA